MAATRAPAGFLSPLLARPRALLALWAAPAAVLALLTSLVGPPAAAFAQQRPDPAQTVEVLLRLVAQLYGQLFLLAWLAAPTAALLAGAPLADAVRALARGAVLRVAAALALFLTFALLLTMLPGLMALYVNPLMGLLFLTVGTIGGAALAVGLFGRWMFAPALALEGRGAAEALDASRAEARRMRNFGFAIGLAVLFVLVLAAAAVVGLAAERVAPGSAWARAAGNALVLWPGAALVEAKVAARWLARGDARPPEAPSLALRSRPSRCPRCGVLAAVPVAGGGDVACGGCGLRATVR